MHVIYVGKLLLNITKLLVRRLRGLAAGCGWLWVPVLKKRQGAYSCLELVARLCAFCASGG